MKQWSRRHPTDKIEGLMGGTPVKPVPIENTRKDICNPMAKPKRKLTAAEKREKKRRRREYKPIFINGKQKRVKREPTVDGIPVDEFIRQNADPIWLLQNEMYEELYQWELEQKAEWNDVTPDSTDDSHNSDPSDDDLPF